MEETAKKFSFERLGPRASLNLMRKTVTFIEDVIYLLPPPVAAGGHQENAEDVTRIYY